MESINFKHFYYKNKQLDYQRNLNPIKPSKRTDVHTVICILCRLNYNLNKKLRKIRYENR